MRNYHNHFTSSLRAGLHGPAANDCRRFIDRWPPLEFGRFAASWSSSRLASTRMAVAGGAQYRRGKNRDFLAAELGRQ
jgi:hypothetical protein